MKINRAIKRVIRETKIGRSVYDWTLKQYVNHLWNNRCRKLRKYGRSIIQESNKILTANNLPYFADYGTLLGAVREHGFIKHDDDIDYTVPCNSPSPKYYLLAFDANANFKFEWAFEYKGEITELTFSYEGVLVDFFFSRMVNGIAYNFAYKGSAGDIDWIPYRERRTINGHFQNIYFLGTMLRIPENYDEILTTKYGDWHTPLNYQKSGRKDEVAKAFPPEYMDGFAHCVNRERVIEIG